MVSGLIKDILFAASKKYVGLVVEEAAGKMELRVNEVADKVTEKLEQMTKKSALMIKELVPPIIYSTLFFGAGWLVLIVGASTWIDSLFAVKGAGLIMGGIVLIFFGVYYKDQLEKALAKVNSF